MSFRFLAPLLCLSVAICAQSVTSQAQTPTTGTITTPPPTTTSPTTTTPILTPEPGTILSAASADPQKVKCWVSRNVETAIAACVYTDPAFQVPMANIRLYQLSSTNFVGKSITFKETTTTGTTETYSMEVLNVRLEKVEDTLGRLRHYQLAYYPQGFNANGTGKEPRVLVGYARFAPGKSGRATSDVIFRLHSKIMKALGGSALPLAAPAGAAAATSGDPCDGPPVDDIGEEEETTSSAPLTPGPALSLKP